MTTHKILHWIKNIIGDLTTVWIMATIGGCCGFAINQFRDNPLPLVYTAKTEKIQQAIAKISLKTTQTRPELMEDVKNSVPLDASTVQYLNLPAFREIIEKRMRGTVLDARPEIFHRLGHVPGAISLPREEFEVSYNKQRFVLEKDKSQPIVVYCSSPSCEDSQMVAEALKKLAYTHVYVFKGGWSEWSGAHLPEEQGK